MITTANPSGEPGEAQRCSWVTTGLRSIMTCTAPPIVAEAMGASVTALVAVIAELSAQITRLEADLPTVLTNTPTPRSSDPCQDWG